MKPSEETKAHDDIAYTVVATLHENKLSVGFKAYAVIGFDGEDGAKLYERKEKEDGDYHPLRDHTKAISEAQVFLSGFVKWDGCSNWWFDEQADEKCMRHFWNKQTLVDVGELLARCWDTAKEMMGDKANMWEAMRPTKGEGSGER